jgi:hypothetical protein
MAAAEEVSAPAAEESAPLPQAETVMPVAEATLPEASVVEGEYTAVMQPSSSSSQSPRGTGPVCLLLTGAEVEGSTIPEAVPVEGVVPETKVATGATTEPTETAAPGVAEEVRGNALPEASLEVVRKSRTRSQFVRRRCSRPRRLVAMGSNFSQMISSTQQQYPATWSQCGGPSNG